MTMVTKIGIAGAVALMAFLAASSASLAAHKKGTYSDPTQCTGGACTAKNPDRVVNPDTGSYYKKKKKPSTTSDSSK
jgi:hypothetical protein